jgi:hypothetical protein
LDVWSVILPPENPRISTDNIFTYRSERPYIPIEVRQAKFDKGGTVFLPTTKIENIQMGVPKGSEPETGIPNSTDRRDRCVLRMTITYRDIYGRKYLHMFDYSQLNEWITVSFKQDISKDIDNLDKLS